MSKPDCRNATLREIVHILCVQRAVRLRFLDSQPTRTRTTRFLSLRCCFPCCQLICKLWCYRRLMRFALRRQRQILRPWDAQRGFISFSIDSFTVCIVDWLCRRCCIIFIPCSPVSASLLLRRCCCCPFLTILSFNCGRLPTRLDIRCSCHTEPNSDKQRHDVQTHGP